VIIATNIPIKMKIETQIPLALIWRIRNERADVEMTE
jgi:hypothetical protein